MAIPRGKKKKPRLSRAAAKIADSRHLGQEPVFSKDQDMSMMDMIKALNWYNYMLTRNEGVPFIFDYYKTRDKKRYAALKKVDDRYINLTMCWVARLVDRGERVPASDIAKIDVSTDEIIAKYTRAPEPTTEKVVVLIDRAKERESEIIGDIEEMIDKSSVAVYDYLTQNSIPKQYANKIIEYYTPILTELNAALEGKDAVLKEGYKSYKKPQLRALIALFESIIADCDKYAENKKIVRKPRAKKKVSIEKKVARVQYMERFDEMQLVSKSPECIIGAKELWIFDARYKNLYHFVSDTGFEVKGTTLLNVNEDLTQGKKVGRKSKEFVDRVLNDGKIALRKLMGDIKSNPFKPNGRINKNMLILKSIS